MSSTKLLLDDRDDSAVSKERSAEKTLGPTKPLG